MKLASKLLLCGLLALIAVVLIINVRYLYTAPIANTWIWWPGDETWLMSQYHEFVTTGHYINPLAPGSIFAQSSGLMFGSCYLTAALYGLPLLLGTIVPIIKGHTIDVGRTISFVFSILTLFALWMIAKRYNVRAVLRAFGCLLLASTVCFFMTSHSARSDMLIGLTILIIAGYIPLMVDKPQTNWAIVLGLLIPISLLVNGHVLIVSFLTIGYATWSRGIFRSKKSVLQCIGAATAGFACLLIIQWALLGSLSLVGPFNDTSSTMPFARLLHPRAHLTNYNWRLFIANSWSPGVMWVAEALLAAIIWGAIRYKIRFSQMEPAARRFIICAALIVLSSIYIEYYWPRYLIYVLPTIVLSFLIVIAHLLRTLPRSSATALTIVLSVCLAFAILKYQGEASRLGAAGEIITAANESAVTDALSTIHSRQSVRSDRFHRPRIFSTVPGQGIVMDDSCDLLTPVMYDWKGDHTLTRDEVWQRAKIDYAIVCNQAQGNDRGEADSSIDWLARSRARLIFERAGPISDIDRPYDLSNLKLLDTLRVYEF